MRHRLLLALLFSATLTESQGILNARIQAVRIKSRGHRSYEAFKRDVLFHLGGLELHPVFPS